MLRADEIIYERLDTVLNRLIRLAILVPLLLSVTPSWAFDLEDYASTYRATREQWISSRDALEKQSDVYMTVRAAAVGAGIDPNDAKLLDAINSDGMTITCGSAAAFDDAALAYGRLISFTSAYLPDHIANLKNDMDDSQSDYRLQRSAQLQTFKSSFGDPVIPGAETGTRQADLLALLLTERDELRTAVEAHSNAIPAYKAAMAAYRAASTTYSSVLRTRDEYFVIQESAAKTGISLSDPRLELIAPLPNTLK